MKSFIAKRLNSILVNLRFKLLKYQENNNKICNTIDHNLIIIIMIITFIGRLIRAFLSAQVVCLTQYNLFTHVYSYNNTIKPIYQSTDIQCSLQNYIKLNSERV